MNYIEAPNEYDGEGLAVFLAGGISDVENWQQSVVEVLSKTDCTILNPRRSEFPTGNKVEEHRQIEWEWRYLQRAELVVFWFPPQTLCPIALFELGTCCSGDLPIVVGCDPKYARLFDLVAQLRLRRPEVELVQSIDELAERVVQHPALNGEAP